LVGLTDGAFLNLKVHDLIPFVTVPDFIGGWSICEVGLIFVMINAAIYAYSNITYGLSKTSEPKLEALMGLLPLVFFYFALYLTFSTRWALENPALAVLLIGPMYCTMATK